MSKCPSASHSLGAWLKRFAQLASPRARDPANLRVGPDSLLGPAVWDRTLGKGCSLVGPSSRSRTILAENFHQAHPVCSLQHAHRNLPISRSVFFCKKPVFGFWTLRDTDGPRFPIQPLTWVTGTADLFSPANRGVRQDGDSGESSRTVAVALWRWVFGGKCKICGVSL